MGIPTNTTIADNVRTESEHSKLVTVHIHRDSPIGGRAFTYTGDVQVVRGVPSNMHDLCVAVVDWASVVHKEDGPGDHASINTRIALVDSIVSEAAKAAVDAAAQQPDGAGVRGISL